jgi:hypothetical protein
MEQSAPTPVSKRRRGVVKRRKRQNAPDVANERFNVFALNRFVRERSERSFFPPYVKDD